MRVKIEAVTWDMVFLPTMGFIDLLIYLKIFINSLLFSRNKIADWWSSGDQVYMVCDEPEHPGPRTTYTSHYLHCRWARAFRARLSGLGLDSSERKGNLQLLKIPQGSKKIENNSWSPIIVRVESWENSSGSSLSRKGRSGRMTNVRRNRRALSDFWYAINNARFALLCWAKLVFLKIAK